MLSPDYASIETPAGFSMNSSFYMPLDDGTQVFYDVWLPENLQFGEKIPTIVLTSRYTRHVKPSSLYKVLMTYLGEPDLNYDQARRYLERGYAYVFIQSPGSAGFTGIRGVEYPPTKIEAMGKIVDWITAQEWSNGKIGSTGRSYSATTADMIAAANRSEIKAV
ncbi:CocE/NonD family hydrolase, partial [candidate division KSB1 bacterium]